MKGTIRSWSSVCADCALYQTRRCPAKGRNRSPDDCIAAVCAGFVPAQAPTEIRKPKEGETLEPQFQTIINA